MLNLFLNTCLHVTMWATLVMYPKLLALNHWSRVGQADLVVSRILFYVLDKLATNKAFFLPISDLIPWVPRWCLVTNHKQGIYVLILNLQVVILNFSYKLCFNLWNARCEIYSTILYTSEAIFSYRFHVLCISNKWYN